MRVFKKRIFNNQIKPNQTVKSNEIKRSSIIRPEDLGEDYSELSTEELLDKFNLQEFEEIYRGKYYWKNEKCIAMRKAAQVLGDRSIAGTLVLKEWQKKKIERITMKYIQIAKDSDFFEEMNGQRRRLWNLAVPGLIKLLGHDDRKISSLAGQLLCKYKNEELVERWIEEALNMKEERQLIRCIQEMRNLQYHYEVKGKNRENITRDEGAILYQEKVVPAVIQLKAKLEQMKK